MTNTEHNNNYETDERNETEELPPTAKTGVMEASCCYRDSRHQKRQGINEGQHVVNQRQDYIDDDVNKHVHPKFLTRSAAMKVGVVVPDWVPKPAKKLLKIHNLINANSVHILARV